jgi:hypothetical protein
MDKVPPQILHQRKHSRKKQRECYTLLTIFLLPRNHPKAARVVYRPDLRAGTVEDFVYVFLPNGDTGFEARTSESGSVGVLCHIRLELSRLRLISEQTFSARSIK